MAYRIIRKWYEKGYSVLPYGMGSGEYKVVNRNKKVMKIHVNGTEYTALVLMEFTFKNSIGTRRFVKAVLRGGHSGVNTDDHATIIAYRRIRIGTLIKEIK